MTFGALYSKNHRFLSLGMTLNAMNAMIAVNIQKNNAETAFVMNATKLVIIRIINTIARIFSFIRINQIYF